MTVFTSPLADVPLQDISITERVFQGLGDDPDRVVLVDGPSGRSLTAGAFRMDVCRLAGGLVSRGMGGAVAILLPNCPDFCVAFHGVAYAGGTITTINPTYTAHEARHQLNDAAAGMLITMPALLPMAVEAVAGTGVRQIVVVGGADGYASLHDLMGAPLAGQVPVDLDRHVLVVPYSSGTTGLPKGVMLSHRNLVVNVDQILQVLEVRPGDVTVGFLPFFHIYGMTVLMNLFLGAGGVLVTLPRFDLEMFLRLTQTHRARILLIAPPVAIALAKHPMVDQFDMASVEVLVSGAAPLSGALADAVGRRLGCVAVQGYGMTEMSPVSHFTPHTRPAPGAVGITVANTLCRIVDPDTGADLGPGQAGELWVKGPQVMLGYLNNPEATGATLQDGWLRTGDLAVMDEGGMLSIRDRLKELIKVKGFQVAPAEVEAELLAHASIADAAVIGIADDEAGEVPVAFVVPVAGVLLDGDAIRAALRDRLANYKVPVRIEVIDSVPKSASGKILRRVLRDRV